MRKWTIATTLLMALWVIAPVSAHAEEKAAEATEEVASEEKSGTEAESEEANKKDAKKKEEVEKLNEADSMVFQTEKQIKEFGVYLVMVKWMNLKVWLDYL